MAGFGKPQNDTKYMNILYLTHDFPYPPDEGIRIVNYNLLKQLSKRHRITLLSLVQNESQNEYIEKISAYCHKVKTVVREIPKSALLRLKNILFQKYPFCVYQFYSKDFEDTIRKSLAEDKYDVLHFDFVNTSIYRDSAGGVPAVYFPHDAMSMLFYRNIPRETSLLRKIYTYSQYRKMRSYEKYILKKFQKTAVVSPVDRDWLLNICGDSGISVIPNGIDTEYFKPFDVREDYPSVIFRGIMSFLPNIDAVEYFCRQILPLIKKEIPEVRFYIVGSSPGKQVLKYHDGKSVIVTGHVEDIREYILKATVNVCPMRVGSGIKNKILEAMALEKATVATGLACDGIPELKNGENIMVADTPPEFAKKAVELIKNRDLRRKFGNNSREIMVENYGWDKIARKFEELYKEAVDNRG